jgi:hypothetical protein
LFLAATAKSDPLLYWNGSYQGAWMFWQAQMCLHMCTWSVTSSKRCCPLSSLGGKAVSP